MKKQLVTPVDSPESRAKMGQELLGGKIKALVKYKRQCWDAKDLLDFLAEKVRILEKNQCIPSAKCLFEGQQYLDDKYIPEE